MRPSSWLVLTVFIMFLSTSNNLPVRNNCSEDHTLDEPTPERSAPPEMTSQGQHRVKRQDIDKAECSSRKKVGDRSWLAKLSDWLQSDTGAIVIPVSAVVILCWIIASCVTFCAKPWDKCCGVIWSCRCCSAPKSGTTSQKVAKQPPAQELQKKESSSSIDSSDSSSSSGSSIATVVFSETSV